MCFKGEHRQYSARFQRLHGVYTNSVHQIVEFLLWWALTDATNNVNHDTVPTDDEEYVHKLANALANRC